MHAVLAFPNIGPEIFAIDFGFFRFGLRWYAMAYIVGIILGWRMAVFLVRRERLWQGRAPLTSSQVDDYVTWIIIGIIAGGRIGYVLFYKPLDFLARPWEIPMIWQGGMAFHGGAIGVALAIYFFAKRQDAPLANVADMTAMCIPPGIFLGRLANFINAELWGLPSTVPWAVVFPTVSAQDCPGVEGACARHPSQLYEAGLEGLLLGLMMFWLIYARGWLKTPWAITGVFLAGYGASRFLVEFYRQADAQYITPENPLGYVIELGFVGLKMGQLLSLPMIVGGIALLALARRQREVQRDSA
ncbi:MAG: prolipoprotein diacylglyceryl transferase [Pseudomonadota bacterium]